jgi:hypothetical protein
MSNNNWPQSRGTTHQQLHAMHMEAEDMPQPIQIGMRYRVLRDHRNMLAGERCTCIMTCTDGAQVEVTLRMDTGDLVFLPMGEAAAALNALR